MSARGVRWREREWTMPNRTVDVGVPPRGSDRPIRSYPEQGQVIVHTGHGGKKRASRRGCGWCERKRRMPIGRCRCSGPTTRTPPPHRAPATIHPGVRERDCTPRAVNGLEPLRAVSAGTADASELDRCSGPTNSRRPRGCPNARKPRNSYRPRFGNGRTHRCRS